MKKYVAAATMLGLAACGQLGGDSGGLKPGKWSTTTEIESVEMPGVSPAMVEQMKSSMKAPPVEVCLTKEMVAKPGAEFFGAPAGGGCTSEKMEIKDGKISTKMSCSAGGVKSDIAMEGTMTPESYTLRSTVSTEMPGGKTSKTVAKVESKRVGDC